MERSSVLIRFVRNVRVVRCGINAVLYVMPFVRIQCSVVLFSVWSDVCVWFWSRFGMVLSALR